MSDYTPSGLPFESRQYRCERHPLYENPSGCSTCDNNRSRRQFDRECGQRALCVIDQATRDYSTSSTHRDLQQDLSGFRTSNGGDLRSTAKDPVYGSLGNASPSHHRSHDTGKAHETGFGGIYPAGSSSFRDPFEGSKYAGSNQNGNLRLNKSAGSDPTIYRQADQQPPDSRDLGFLGSSSRGNGLSGNSGSGWSDTKCS